MHVVHFDIPPCLKRSAVWKRECGDDISYRHNELLSCQARVRSADSRRTPVQTVQYVLRLDGDSFILKQIGHNDIFRLMHADH